MGENPKENDDEDYIQCMASSMTMFDDITLTPSWRRVDIEEEDNH